MRVEDYSKMKAEGASEQAVIAAIRADAARLGGELDDMARRSVVYHHLYVTMGCNFIFPLIAAHGALWARWYLVAARMAATVFAVIDIIGPGGFREKMARYQDYVDAFKAINRKVMIETYVVCHVFRLYGAHPDICDNMPESLQAGLVQCDKKAPRGEVMSHHDQRQVYEDFFRWEQVNVVGPAVDAAIAEFNWPLMEWFCMRPWVWFSYFRLGKALRFKDFKSADERTHKGLIAFDWGARHGWDKIEANLVGNPFFPKNFAFDANEYFEDLPAISPKVPV